MVWCRDREKEEEQFFMVINVHVCVYQRTVDWSKEPLACSVERIACT
jgi:hypothetical protein